ncbi:MAG: sensor histidine kinase [Cyclobacteriaceae bacterium]|nr:sensor histidine kinase [Cyclobacteriaceae bacterium]
MEGIFGPVGMAIGELQTVLVQVPVGAPTQVHENDLIQRTVLLALIPVVVAFSFVVFVFYRARREAYFRHKETELKLSLAEGELKALRAQINPHFIFNCLNSIHHYMFTNDGPKAGEYLIKFSRLIRHVLESSALRSVSLADEIAANRIYIEMEQLRMNYELTYHIHIAPGLDVTQLEIPPMMIQPFVENAIWHGLGSGGVVELHFLPAANRHIQCIIKDEGKKEYAHVSTDLSGAVKKSSMGTSLMRERFNLINNLHQTQASFTLADRTDGVKGKQVTLTIPLM